MLRFQFLFAVTSLLSVAQASLAQAEMLPQTAVVRSDRAMVYSGPGEAFYATQELGQGANVEVYRITPSGWCAIRPPADSFSYVRADEVRATEVPQVIEVIANGATTRVGSLLHARHNVAYISLNVGEKLQRLSSPIGLENSVHRWYRVAPPAGEFRWMRQMDLLFADGSANELDHLPPASSPPPHPAVSASQSPAGTMLETSASSDEHVSVSGSAIIADASVGTDVGQPAAVSSPVLSGSVPSGAVSSTPAMPETVPLHRDIAAAGQMKTEPIAAMPSTELPTGPATASGAERAAGALSTQHAAAWTAVADAPEPMDVGADQMPSPPASSPFADSFSSQQPSLPESDPAREIVELELALSQIVSQDISQWQLRDLYQATEQVIHGTGDAAIQVQARTLRDRITQFAELRQRHLQLRDQPPVTGQPISLANALLPVVPDPGAAMVAPASNAPGMMTPGVDGAAYSPHAAGSSPAISPQQPASAAMPTSLAASPYAGQGWLVPVVTGRADVPQFALTDDAGNVRFFVSPVPGLNLRRYQRQEVGIIGRPLGASQETASHLVAERVVLLRRHSR